VVGRIGPRGPTNNLSLQIQSWSTCARVWSDHWSS